MKRILLITVVLFVSLDSFGQNYYTYIIDTLHKYNVKKLVINSDNNYVIAGFISKTIDEPRKGFIIEYDSKKKLKSFIVKKAEDNYQNYFSDIVIMNNGYGVSGYKKSTESIYGYGYFLNVTTSGDIVTSYQCDTLDNTVLIKGCHQRNSKEVFIYGHNEINAKWYPYLSKLDSQANFLWDTTYLEIPSHAWIQDIALSSDGGLYLFMTIDKSQFSSDALLMKTDSLGNQEWGKIFNYAARDAASKVIVSIEGGFLITLEALFGNQRIVKLDEDRNIEFVIDHFFTDQYIADVVQLEDSTYVIMGSIDTYGNSWEDKTDIQLVKIDHKGNVLWNRIYEDEDYDAAKSMVATPDGGFMLACNKDVGPVDKIFLIKTNCMGLLTEPEASFSFEEAAGEVAFTNTSMYVYPDSIDGGYYVWNFGDGSPVSNEVNPVHTYSEADEYTVRLTGIVCSDTSVYEQTVLVTTTSVSSPASSPSLVDALRVYPNPVDGDVLYFEVGGNYAGQQQGRILFYSTLGQLVLQNTFKNKVNVSDLPGGVYFVVVEIGGERIVEKVVVN